MGQKSYVCNTSVISVTILQGEKTSGINFLYIIYAIVLVAASLAFLLVQFAINGPFSKYDKRDNLGWPAYSRLYSILGQTSRDKGDKLDFLLTFSSPLPTSDASAWQLIRGRREREREREGSGPGSVYSEL